MKGRREKWKSKCLPANRKCTVINKEERGQEGRGSQCWEDKSKAFGQGLKRQVEKARNHDRRKPRLCKK